MRPGSISCSRGAERARLLVIAIDNEEQALRIVDLAHEHFPNLRILARAATGGAPINCSVAA